jgi:hypothetical protein
MDLNIIINKATIKLKLLLLSNNAKYLTLITIAAKAPYCLLA